MNRVKTNIMIFLVTEVIALATICLGWGFVGCIEIVCVSFYNYYYKQSNKRITTGVWLGIAGTEVLLLMMFLRLQIMAIFY